MRKLQGLPFLWISLQGYHESRYATEIRHDLSLDGIDPTVKLSITEKLAPDSNTEIMHDGEIQNIDFCEFLLCL